MIRNFNIWALIAALLLFVIFAVHFINYAPDDMWISMRYADNLINGEGLVFNPGQKVEGYSNFLWVMFMAFFGAAKTKEGLTLFAKFTGILFGIGSLLVIAAAAKTLPARESGRAYWGLAPLGFGLAAIPAFWSACGMETGLYLLLMAVAIASYLRYAKGGEALWGFVASFYFLALALSRPEGVIFFAVAMVVELFFLYRGKDDFKLSFALFALFFMVTLAAFFLWRHSYYGQWWPNTFYAKAGGGLAKYAEGVRYLLINLPRLFWSNPLLLLIFVPLFIDAKKIGKGTLFLSLCVLAQLFFAFYAGGDWMPGARFLVPAVPALALLLPSAIGQLKKQLGTGLAPRSKILVLITILVSLVLHLYSVKQISHQPSGFSGIRSKQFFRPHHFRVAEWLSQNSKSKDLIAVGEAGLIPYLTGLPALDLFGLMDTHLARQPGVRHSKVDNDYVFAQKPRYIVLGGCTVLLNKITSDFEYARTLLGDPRLESLYSPVYSYHTFLIYELKEFSTEKASESEND